MSEIPASPLPEKLHKHALEMYWELVQVLDAIDGMVDVDAGDEGEACANWAMRLQMSIEEVLRKVESKPAP